MRRILAVPALMAALVLTMGASMAYYIIDASQIASGTISASRLPSTIPALTVNADQITGGNLSNNRLPGIISATTSVQAGGNTNYAKIDATGLIQAGSGRTWNDFNMEAANLRTGPSTPSYTTVGPAGAMYGLVFIGSGAATDEVHCSTEMLHDWAEGTTAHVHLHWSPTTTATGNVAWYVDYSWVDVNGAMATPGQTIAITPAEGVAWKHYISEMIELPGTGHTIGSILQLRVSRNPGQTADTAGDAWLRSVGVHVLQDRLGSTSEATK